MASAFSTARPGRRTRQRSSCCTAFLPPAICSAISSRNSRTGFISLLPTCRRSASPTCRRVSAFTYTFENIANVIDRFTEVIGLSRFAIYVFDYGAPVGFRLAVRHPDRLTAIISQNGNAYEEGLSDGWNPIRAYWQEPSQVNRDALRSFLAPDTTRWQYVHGVPEVTAVLLQTAIRSTTSICPAPAPTRFSWICSATTRATSHSTQLSKITSGRTNHVSWPYGEKTIPSFCHGVPRRSNATFPTRRFVSSTRGTSRLRPMQRRSQRSFET